MPYSKKVAELLALAERAGTPEARDEFLRLAERYRTLNAHHHTDAPQVAPEREQDADGIAELEPS
jgi:hypothetical protein